MHDAVNHVTLNLVKRCMLALRHFAGAARFPVTLNLLQIPAALLAPGRVI